MRGCIDFAVSPAIRGWVRVDDDSFGRVEVWREEKLIAEAEPSSARADFADSTQRKGFQCIIPGGYSLEELATQNMKVVWCSGNLRINLEIWEPILIASQIVSMPDDKLMRMVTSMKSQQVRRLIEISEKTLDNNIIHEKTEGLFNHYGSVSKDNIATVGAGGHYFLFRGSNNLIDIYKKPKASDATLNGWEQIIAERSSWADQHKIGYVQVFIPEKSSLTPHLVPYGVSGPSKIWEDILDRLSEYPEILDCHKLLSDSFSPEAAFRKQDSHLATYGAMQIAAVIVEKITGDRITCRKIESKRLQLVGDLAKRFDGFPAELLESLEVLDEVEINEALVLPPQLVTSFDPTQGHIGIRRIWKNDSAPFSQRVICFGNSFFERGGTSASLSWWLSRLFKEFHFIWSPNIDSNYVEHVKGDFVICQTIERFLERVPEK